MPSVKRSLLDEQCRFDSFSAHCRLVGTELTFIRSVTRFDSGACNLRVSQCSSESHKLGLPGATPGPATYMVEYANRKSDLVESQVILQVRLLSQPPGSMIAWSSG